MLAGGDLFNLLERLLYLPLQIWCQLLFPFHSRFLTRVRARRVEGSFHTPYAHFVCCWERQCSETELAASHFFSDIVIVTVFNQLL